MLQLRLTPIIIGDNHNSSTNLVWPKGAMNKQPNTIPNVPLEQLLSLREAAVVSHLSVSHLRNWVATGRIAGVKLGTNWFTTKAAIEAYLAAGHKPGPKPKLQRTDPPHTS